MALYIFIMLNLSLKYKLYFYIVIILFIISYITTLNQKYNIFGFYHKIYLLQYFYTKILFLKLYNYAKY